MRPAVRPLLRASAAPYAVAATAANGGGANLPGWVQQVIDPEFADATKWTLSGSGIGTSAVTGGVLQITSTDNVYLVLSATLETPLIAGVYTVTYTILNYVGGTISLISSLASSLTSSTITGTPRAANGTFTESMLCVVPRYIGFTGRGSAIVNNMQIDSLTIMRAA